MLVVHLTASTFHGGPERQMLGLARGLPPEYRTVFLSFREEGRCRPFLAAARKDGFEALELANDTPRLRSAMREISDHLERLGADVLCCHGYKGGVLGRLAARRRGVPVVAVSRGWTRETLKVRFYEALDRLNLRWMDRVVCVSEAQAAKVRRAGVRPGRITVIHNAVDPERFGDPEPLYRTKMLRYFRRPPARLIGAAGRLSPEKGFAVLVAAAERVAKKDPSVGFLLFGEGKCREKLKQQIAGAGLKGSFVLGGFRADLDRFLPYFDLLVLPSYTEGLPNVVLEAFAAGVPVVATKVGGTPEVVADGASGYLVPPGDPDELAERILEAVASEERLRDMGLHGRQQVVEQFTFAAQARKYQQLWAEVAGSAPVKATTRPTANEKDRPTETTAKHATSDELVSTGKTNEP
jgi:glycosyltransferase involved in cell wall biosynthesis